MGWDEEGREVRLPRLVSYACSYLAGGVRKGGVKGLRLARYISVTYLGWSVDLYSASIPTYIGRRVNHYWSACEPILVATWIYIGRLSDQYRSSRLQNRRRSGDVRQERGVEQSGEWCIFV